MQRLTLVLFLPFVVVGCGDDDPADDATPVDCAWFQGPDNCIRTVLADIRACRPPEGTSGTWNTDNTACTYDSGAVVEFTEAVPEDPFSQSSTYTYAFTLKDASGGDCAEITETESGITVTTASGTYSDRGDFTNVTVTCPDGQSVQAATADAFSCIGSLNGFTATGRGGGESLSFSLIGGGDSEEAFRCEGM